MWPWIIGGVAVLVLLRKKNGEAPAATAAPVATPTTTTPATGYVAPPVTTPVTLPTANGTLVLPQVSPSGGGGASAPIVQAVDGYYTRR